jgi:hypothetical protein
MYRQVTAIVALCAAVTLVVHAQGKTSPPPSYKATAAFRCYVGMPTAGMPCAVATSGTDESIDRARGDAATYDYEVVRWKSQGTNYTAGSLLANQQQYILRLIAGTPTISPNRFLKMELGTPLVQDAFGGVHYLAVGDALPCETAGNCNPTGRPAGSFTLMDVELIVKPLIPGTLEDWMTAFAEMPCNQEVASIATFTFPDLHGNGHWGLNFNPRGQPESSTLTVLRISRKHWTIRATASERAVLIGYGHSGTSGKLGASKEGLYRVPFEIDLTTAGDVPAGTGCSS